MKKNLLVLLSLLAIASMALAACAPAQTQESPTGYLGEATGPQTTSIQPKAGSQFAILLNEDYLVEGGSMATFSMFGESNVTHLDVEIQAGILKDTRSIPVGEQFLISKIDINDTVEVTILNKDLDCVKRDVSIWDCKPK